MKRRAEVHNANKRTLARQIQAILNPNGIAAVFKITDVLKIATSMLRTGDFSDA